MWCETARNQGGLIFHDFRRTVKTYLVDAGISGAHRDTILGHNSKRMDEHYVKPPDASLKTAMDEYIRWLDAEIEANSQLVDQAINLERTQI